MTNSISSTSNISLTSELAPNNEKKRALTWDENGNNPSEHPSKRLKTDSNSTSQAFEKTLSEATAIWTSHNNALVANSLMPLFKSPLSDEQRELVLKLLDTTRSTEPDSKNEVEVALFNADLYQKIKENNQKELLTLLAHAIENKQLALIIRLLQQVDLSQDNAETRYCVEKAAKSIPTIACLILDKKPPCAPLFLKWFFRRAFEYSNVKLFAALLAFKPDFPNLDLDNYCAEAILEQGPFRDLILTIEPLLESPAAFNSLIEINRRDLTAKIAAKDPTIAQKAFDNAIYNKISFPLNDKMKAHIQSLIALGASFNKEHKDLLEYSPLGNLDMELVVESLIWLTQQGLKDSVQIAFSFRGESPFDIVAFLKALPVPFLGTKEMFNQAFNGCCKKELYEPIYQISLKHARDLIDHQSSLDALIKTYQCSASHKLKFLQDLGANLFGRNGDNLLTCHYSYFPYFREHSGYKEALSKTDKNGLGVMTHLFLNSTNDEEEECLEPLNKIVEDIRAQPPKNFPTILQDIFCCSILLYRYKLNPPSNFKNLMSRIPEIPYQKQEEYLGLLLKGCREEMGPDYKFHESDVLNAYDDLVCAFENRLFQVHPTHFQQAAKAARLTEQQQKEIASVDILDSIEKMLVLTNFSTRRAGDEKTVRAFLQNIKERTQVTGVPPGIPNEILKSSFQKAFENFERACRASVPISLFNKVLCDFPAFMKYQTIADKAFEVHLKSLKTAFEKEFPSGESLANVLNLLQPFVDAQTKKENFYSELEEKLRIIIYSYSLGKAAASAASSSSAALTAIDLDSAFTLLCTIVEAMDKCATKWASDLQLFEEFALETIQKAEKNNGSTQEVKKLTDLECQLHTVLAQERSRLIRAWAGHWTQKRIALRRQKQENIAVQNAEYGLEIHYGYAALQHRGQYLGIPRAEKNVEHLVTWTKEMDNDLMAFIQSNYSLPTRVIDFISGAINQIDKACVIDWMQDNLLGNWNEDIYADYESKATSSIQGVWEASTKADASREQLFNKIWEVLSEAEGILFNDFRSSIQHTVQSGKTLDVVKSSLLKIVKDASLKSRKKEFNSEIHDNNGLIKRSFFRKFLLMHQIIKAVK